MTNPIKETIKTQSQVAAVRLPGGGQRSVRVEVDVMDSFTVAFLMQDLLLNLQVPQTPRVVIAADQQANV